MQKKGSTYSDIHTFANAVARVEKFLKRACSQKKRYYEPTRMLYLKIAQTLENCAKLAYQLAGKQIDAATVEKNCRPVVKNISLAKEVISDSAFELVLASVDKAEEAKPVQVSKDRQITAKQTISRYLRSCKLLANSARYEQKEVARCAMLLSNWLQLRFGKKSDVFHYNSENIKVWIDRFIYAYGYHWKVHLLNKFELDLKDWSDSLRKVDCKYPLPAFIFNMESDDDPDMYCAECIVLERMIKIVIYTDDFYPDQLHSIEKKVLIERPEYIGLTIDELKSKCSDS